MNAEAYTRHTAGEMVDGIQRCVVCGHVLIDYTKTRLVPSDAPLSKGWKPGHVYVLGNYSANSIGESEPFNDCKP